MSRWPVARNAAGFVLVGLGPYSTQVEQVRLSFVTFLLVFTVQQIEGSRFSLSYCIQHSSIASMLVGARAIAYV